MELKCKSINSIRFCSDCEICFVVFACLGFLSPANRGALMTCTLVLYVCLGTPAGYVSARVYKSKACQVSSAENMFPFDKEKAIVCWKFTRIHRFHVAFNELHLIRYILWGFQYLYFFLYIEHMCNTKDIWYVMIKNVETILPFFFRGMYVSVH